MRTVFRKAAPVLAAAAFAANAQEIDLSYAWQAGDKLTYAMTNVSTQDQTAMGNQSKTDSSSEQVITIEVLGVDAEGNSTIRQTVDSIKMSVNNSNGMEMSYDSDAESNASAAANPAVASLAALDGAVFTVVLGPDGSVIDLPDYEQWRQESGADATPEQMALLAAAPDKDALMQNLEGAYKTLAGKTMSRGEAWTTEMRNEFAPGAFMVFSFENTVAAVENRSGDKQADIHTTGKIDLTTPANSPMELKISEQDIKGVSTYSSEKGAMTSSEGSVRMVMTGGFPGAEPMMNMTMNQTSTMKLVSFERGG